MTFYTCVCSCPHCNDKKINKEHTNINKPDVDFMRVWDTKLNVIICFMSIPNQTQIESQKRDQ